MQHLLSQLHEVVHGGLQLQGCLRGGNTPNTLTSTLLSC